VFVLSTLLVVQSALRMLMISSLHSVLLGLSTLSCQQCFDTVACTNMCIGRRLGHYGDHPRPQVADRGTPSRVDKRVAPDKEGAADKQCQGEGKL